LYIFLPLIIVGRFLYSAIPISKARFAAIALEENIKTDKIIINTNIENLLIISPEK